MIESMKEKTRRLERIIKGKNAGKTDTFVFSEVRKMIELALAEEREACAKMLDDEADRQQAVWNEFIATGNDGPATSFHAIPRKYAAQIRARDAAPKDEVSE